MFFTVEVFLDAILLLINQRGHADILKMVNRFLEIYDLEFKNDIHMGGEGEYIRFYVNVIKELMIPGLDESDIERCLLKFKMSSFVRTHPEVYEILEGIMVQTKPLSEDKQAFLRKRMHEQEPRYFYRYLQDDRGFARRIIRLAEQSHLSADG